jgi:putative Holliday junction resolvase
VKPSATGLPRVLGIDYGRARVGIAVSDPLGIVARGVTVLTRTGSLVADVCRIAAELGAGTLVVGMPLTLRGTKGEIAAEVEEFIAALRRECGLPVIAVDERFSSSRAEATMIDMGVPRKKRRVKGEVDRIAAALILQDYLDRGAGPGAPPPA